MSGHLLRKYIDIINESVNEKVDSPYAVGMAVAKKKYGYGEKPAHDLPKKVIKKAHEIAKKVNEEVNKETQHEAGYVNASSSGNKCSNCVHFIAPHSCKIVEGYISPGGWCKHYASAKIGEKWDTETKVNPSEKGKYAGKTVEELRKSYNALKASGPHHKGSPEYGRMRELAFAIRAKTGWGGV